VNPAHAGKGEERFAFGRNWRRFLDGLGEEQIREAERSLAGMLEVRTLDGLSFLDAGSGSGLFSLAARRLGATVHSFDFDPDAVACAAALKARNFPDDADWKVEQGSVLDPAYLSSLGNFDLVYSWGVLHHTGRLWEALELIAARVKPGGTLFIALYNDQGPLSRAWGMLKRTYVLHPVLHPVLRPLLLAVCFTGLWGPRLLIDLLRLRPLTTWRGYVRHRGMSPWTDVVDWAGGSPFEVASPDAVVDFLVPRGFSLRRIRTVGGRLGNNQFVFRRSG